MKEPIHMLTDLLINAVSYAADKLVHAEFEFDTVNDIDEKWIEVLEEQYGIKGIVLDLDDTVRIGAKQITKRNVEWMKLMLKHFKIIVLTDTRPGISENILNDLEIDNISFALKPSKIGFKKACKKLGLKPENVLVIGDHLIADIYGAHRNKMLGAQIKRVKEDNEK